MTSFHKGSIRCKIKVLIRGKFINTDRLNERMQELTDSGEMAAGTLMISQNGDRIFEGKWGYLNQEEKIPVQYDTIFRIMSMTKVLIAVGVTKLYEEQKIGLDDEIARYLPEYGNRNWQ